jgi:uncharacterized membrane protein YczE
MTTTTRTTSGSHVTSIIRRALGWGARAIPEMPWSATRSRWELRPATLAVLTTGLWAFGTGEALLVDAHLGNSPWTALSQGISRHSPLSIGMATLAISVFVLVAWIPLRERPGFGTFANAVVIAVAIDRMLPLLPQPTPIAWRLLEVAAGISAIGFGSVLYLTAHLGPGPRDGWMVAIARLTGRPIPLVRLGIESAVLTTGWFLGGAVGIGTLLFALLVGHTIGIFLRAASAVRTRAAVTSGYPS